MAGSNVGGWGMGYYDGSKFKLWQWAREYTLADNFFMAAYGGSCLTRGRRPPSKGLARKPAPGRRADRFWCADYPGAAP